MARKAIGVDEKSQESSVWNFFPRRDRRARRG